MSVLWRLLVRGRLTYVVWPRGHPTLGSPLALPVRHSTSTLFVLSLACTSNTRRHVYPSHFRPPKLQSDRVSRRPIALSLPRSSFHARPFCRRSLVPNPRNYLDHRDFYQQQDLGIGFVPARTCGLLDIRNPRHICTTATYHPRANIRSNYGYVFVSMFWSLIESCHC